MTHLFNRRALQQRYRVGDTGVPVNLLTPPLRLTLLLGLVIAAGGGLWATFARIPISVQGTGVLLPVSTINSSLSGTKGNAHWIFNQGQQAWHKRALLFLRRPSELNDSEVALLSNQVLLAGERIRQSRGSNRVEGLSSSKRFANNLRSTYQGKLISRDTLMLWIQSPESQESLQSALDQLERTTKNADAQSINIGNKQMILKDELSSKTAYLNQMKSLEDKGYVSKANILDYESQVDGIRSQLLDNDNQLISLRNQVSESYQNLRKQLATLIGEEMIFTEKDVYLSQVVPNDGEVVGQGQVVLELSDESIDNPALVPVFLSSKEMAQVFPGMPVIATPSGYKRSEVGGIRGEVISMSKIASSLEDVTARIGVRSLAEVIMQQEPAPTLAILALERTKKSMTDNNGGYVWSSKGDLPFPPSPGDRLDVEISTRRVAPIQLVLPALRRFFGWVPPEASEARSPNVKTTERR